MEEKKGRREGRGGGIRRGREGERARVLIVMGCTDKRN